MIDRIRGSKVGYAGTSAPSRVVEYSSKGASGVREYILTPEELEEVRQKYPATKRDKTFKKPVAHNPSADRLPAKQRNHKPEEDNEMSGRPEKQGPNNGLTKQIFLEQIASGETVASVEKAWGMKYNTLSFWVKKWDMRGIDAAKAQELLAEATPKETQLLREKEVLPPAEHQAGEVERLKAELAERDRQIKVIKEVHQKIKETLNSQINQVTAERNELKAVLSVTQPISHDLVNELKAEVERWKAQATETVALADKAAEESAAKIERMKEFLRKATDIRIAAEDELVRVNGERDAAELDLEQAETRCSQYAQSIDQLATQCDGLQEELNRLITERDDLVAEVEDLRDDIRRLKEIQTLTAEPTSEVHLLDRSIEELTRAKWILNRLSASSE